MYIDTKNLKIIPLNTEEFKLLLEGTDRMEKKLGLNPSFECLDEHTQQAMTQLYNLMLKNEEDYIWFTNWQVVLKKENISIGSACFMGKIDSQGIVEIGYGMNEKYRNKGFMTEAVKAMCDWALKQPNVKNVIAQTEKENVASHKVLKKCGMNLYKETEDGLFWRFKIKEKDSAI